MATGEEREAVTYLSDSSEGYVHGNTRLFREVVQQYVDRYIMEMSMADQPVSLLHFVVYTAMEVGAETDRKLHPRE